MSASDQGKPQPSRPVMPGYGIPKTKKGMLSWEHVTERLTAARDYWVGTAGSTGAPHAVPVWGVWADDRLYVGGGSEVRWVRNLRANPRVAVHIGSGDDPVIVEGTVMFTDQEGEEVERVMDAYEIKYGFRHPPPFWRLLPQRAFAGRTWVQMPLAGCCPALRDRRLIGHPAAPRTGSGSGTTGVRVRPFRRRLRW